MSAVRPAAVAGSFYPADPKTLRDTLARHLASATGLPRAEGQPKMLVVPHAGYTYSGDVAALGYASLAPWRDAIRRVVLLGPAHRVALRGLAMPTVEAFETPLGLVPLDTEAMVSLESLRQVSWTDLPHAREHSLEAQLPFLQTVLGKGFTLVPLVVGDASPAEVAEVLEFLWGGDETLFVVSSDLSHFLPYAQAQARDRETTQRILGLATDLRGDQACGAVPLNGALLAARRQRLLPRLLGLRNSADSAVGDTEHVVGYAAISFEADPAGAEDTEALGVALVASARQAIAQRLRLKDAALTPMAEHPALYRPGASFVSLHDAAGRLRGCVGSLEATRALGADVRANALAAAFADSRFEPLDTGEWAGLQVEVSLLDAPEPLPVQDEAQALALLRPGVDGVIFEWRGARATLLPQVWAECRQPAQFMAALKRKAHLPADFWARDVHLWRYRVTSFRDQKLPESAGALP